MEDKKQYDAIDGLRSIACIGIVMMHMLANNSYKLSGFVFDKVIPSFTNFVFLFMTISAFGMCCGYFDKVLSRKINFTDFYKKRYLRILPFFAVLVLLDLVMGFTKGALFEAVADVSLMYGFFPHNISVIVVGWFLGVVFAFYIIFPFFCVLIETKGRAWLVFVASLIMNFILTVHFNVGRMNIVYCLCYFILGGLIYQYREELFRFSKDKKILSFIIMVVSVALYYMIGANTLTMLLTSGSILIFSLGKSGLILQNRITHFISSISMEIYLSHMVIFRLIEKLKLNTLIGDGLGQYCLTLVLVLSLTIVFSVILKRLLEITGSAINKKLLLDKGA